VKTFVTALLALVLPAVAVGATSPSGLRGRVMIEPGYPVCKVNQPCVRPAPYVRLFFSRSGRIVARTKTAADGSYRIGLRPGTYAVTSPATKVGDAGLWPRRVSVPAGRYKRVIFRLDLGLQ